MNIENDKDGWRLLPIYTAFWTSSLWDGGREMIYLAILLSLKSFT